MVECKEVVAEISLLKSRDAGIGWMLTSLVPGVPDGRGVATSRTEAVWIAVDGLRKPDDNLRGCVRVFSLGGDCAALAPLYAVPQYELMDWAPWTPPAPVEINLPVPADVECSCTQEIV